MSPEQTKKDIALFGIGALGVREETCMSPFVFPLSKRVCKIDHTHNVRGCW